jgi:Uma2 family endonuclease
MVANPQPQHMTLQDYWYLEEHSAIKHEYIDGYVYDLAGGTAAHSQIAINTVTALNQELQSGPCHVFNSDMRVQLRNDRYVFPDVTVSCDIADAVDDGTIIRSPRLVIEVLSNSTEAKDRGVKFACYQELDSVQEYVIISTTKQSVEVYRRDDEDSDGNRWNYQRYTAGDIVRFECIDVEVKIEDLYRRTKVSPA